MADAMHPESRLRLSAPPPAVREGVGRAGEGLAASSTAPALMADPRWDSWDTPNLRSYLNSQAGSEQRQKQLTRASSRQDLLDLLVQWNIAYLPKEKWGEASSGFGGVRHRVMDIWLEAEQGNLLSVQLYIDQKEDLNRTRDRRRTPLHAAVRGGHPEVARALLVAGAAKELTDMDGETPLMTACRLGKVEVVKVLLQCGCNKDAQDEDGRGCCSSFDSSVDDNTRQQIMQLLGKTNSISSPSRTGGVRKQGKHNPCCTAS